jgi:hypothetical protein
MMLFACTTLAVVTGQESSSKSAYHVGDTLYQAVDRLPANPRLIRSNLEDYWDFTGLMAPYVQELYVRPSSTSEDKTRESNCCVISNGDGVDYTLSVNREGMWISAITLKQDDDLISMICDPALPLRVNTDKFGTEVSYKGIIAINLTTDYVAALDDNELGLADSIRIIVDWKYEMINDQEGQMQLESGHYDVLRQKLSKTISARTEIKQSGQWSVTNKDVLIELPVELTSGRTYSFWSDVHPEAIAVVETDESENAISVTFRALRQSGRRVVQSTPNQADIFVHPNPSFGMVRFDLVNLPQGEYQIEIYNILGVRLRSYSLDVDGSKSYPLNLSDLKKGTYIYRLVDSYRKTLRSKRIVIITP